MRLHRPSVFLPFLAPMTLLCLGCGGGQKSRFNPPVTATHGTAASTRSDNLSGTPGSPHTAPDQVGMATWYGDAFAGKKTSSGERFDPSQMTAAHRKLPFGTWVEVRRTDTGSSVRVRINDRGPWGHENRIIDLSRKAAEQIDLVHAGLAEVQLRVVDGP